MNYTKWYMYCLCVEQTCVAGKYSIAGSTTCLDCPAGKSCGAGTETPTDCNAGHYSLVGAFTCTPCPIGSMCTAKDQGPTLCQEGYYTSSTGNPQSLSCNVEIITYVMLRLLHVIRNPFYVMQRSLHVIRNPCQVMQRLLHVIRNPCHVMQGLLHVNCNPCHVMSRLLHVICNPCHVVLQTVMQRFISVINYVQFQNVFLNELKIF